MVEYLAVLTAIGYGFVSGGGAALLGYARSYFKPKEDGGYGEEFDPEKAGKTLLLGATLGGLAAGFGVDPATGIETVLGPLFFPTLIFVIDAAAVAIVRFIRARLGR